ncbi:hypothetical protein JCM10908_000849 [Rhodotorula pacifica]|uniref:uncharacterized protein n=1 Tax=Rhodotorula pacifica TaxID=1495444 RepID=UPI003182AA1A
MNRSKPQQLIAQTQWPAWAPVALFRLAVLKLALRAGFSPGALVQNKHGSSESLSVACETTADCPFKVSIVRNKRSVAYCTEISYLKHGHELVSWDDSEDTKEEHERIQNEVEATIAAIKRKAREELESFRKDADVAACSTVPLSPAILSPASEQECVLHDLGDALGEPIARAFEAEMRGVRVLADDYPTWSTFDGLAHPLAAPPAQRAPPTLPAAPAASPTGAVPQESQTGTPSASSSSAARKPKQRKVAFDPLVSSSPASPSSSATPTTAQSDSIVSPAKRSAQPATLQQQPVSKKFLKPLDSSRGKKRIIDFSEPSPFTPKTPKPRRAMEPKSEDDEELAIPSSTKRATGGKPFDFGLKSPPATPAASHPHQKEESGACLYNDVDEEDAVLTALTRKSAPSPTPPRPDAKKEESQDRDRDGVGPDDDESLDEPGATIASTSAQAPAPHPQEPETLAEFLRGLSTIFNYEEDYLAKLESINVTSPVILQYSMTQERLSESVKKALKRGDGPVDIQLEEFEDLLRQRRGG